MSGNSGKRLTDCPSNLKEAIDWILRVTGKDGGQGADGQAIKALTQQVKTLLGEVQGSDPKLSAVITKVRQALGNGSDGLIPKLAEGLATFIGYQDGNNQGLIGVDGIAVSNDPLERLRDGVLKFVEEFLKRLKISHNTLQLTVNVDKTISGLIGALGGGVREFDKAMKVLQGFNVSSSRIQNVMTKLKDVINLQNKDNITNFATDVNSYLGNVLGAVENSNKSETHGSIMAFKSSLDELLQQLGRLAGTPIGSSQGRIGTHITKVTRNNANFHPNKIKNKIKNPETKALVEALHNGINGLMGELRKPLYLSSYDKNTHPHADWTHVTGEDHTKCAKIFLGCIPLLFNNLSYLFWLCNQDDWKTRKLGTGALSAFMLSMSFSPNRLNGNKTGSAVVTALEKLEVFKKPDTSSTYAGFLKTIEPKSKNFDEIQNQSFSALFLCASAYFMCHQIKHAAQTRHPSSIRDILYWLASLQFSPHYYSIEKHITTIIPTDGLQVAISGSPNPNEKLTVDQIQDYLVITCIFCPVTLGWIQKSENGSTDPFLHELFSNGMCLKYQSGAALFNDISNYSYALQFQLSFLYQQCKSNYTHGCGWQDCRYGADVHPQSSDPQVYSHICSGYTCSNPVLCWHDGKGKTGCNHHGSPNPTCGSSGKGSPLQAFLSDRLKGFSLPDGVNKIGYANGHMFNHPNGSHCHVPMGFAGKLRSGSGMGGHLYYILLFFCGNGNSPLRQLSEKLSCLTKRTPRSLGDLFGFIWHLNGQLFKSRPNMAVLATSILAYLKASVNGQNVNLPRDRFSMINEMHEYIAKLKSPISSGHVKTIQALYNDLPFWFQLFMVEGSKELPGALFDLRQHCHKQAIPSNGVLWSLHEPAYSPSSNSKHICSTSPADLTSLYYPQCTGQNSCGPYLSPLCHTIGSTFAPMFASAYLSWVLYLTDYLQSKFQVLLEEFQTIQCGSNSATKHDESGSCSCASVVQCSGILPLLYKRGFYYNNMEALNGLRFDIRNGWIPDKSKMRTCANFHTALSNVLTDGAPLHNLLLAIDEFLYYVRFRFMSMISSFWLCSLAILLYFIIYGIDVLHLKSHVHFPSSHGIPPIGLVTTGKAPALTKLTYYMP
ncbi:variant erythrocyte surface antigen-1 family protein [Babesia caballi]|uniref:Variant erythrocyte surface antigen-1 family protein n=1 Tax=Babesia caballi TaxID=5871 RepID=A0AAV4LMT4_BABCB|nr:variant erythrocyte surface antigen-1 family protein [Babesia caballi]